ncbi:MAG TPA: primosomal protein N' [Microbacterium sp.]|uniref:primosomal protein N' family DNA-binding protein n=1 Tax=Microbacterium sp. TaxID=51671 RepID=UPI002C105296|nr:primosomal protein N' [Microbacterium sp.]HWI30723.1 primosomal protein N' [Microbacterium sp.]
MAPPLGGAARMPRRVARVLIDSPLPQLDRLFDYAIPDNLAAEAQPGVRVRVPLRTAGRLVDAYLVELGEADDAERPLSELDAVVSSAAVLPPHLYALARRVADRAAGSAVDILRLVLPKRQVRVEKAWLTADAPPRPVPSDEARAWALKTLAPFAGLGDALPAGERVALDAPPRPAIAPAGGEVGAWALTLAAAAVTVLAEGRSAIIVVPDYRDQEQVESAFDGVLPEGALVRFDARRPNPERYRSFLRALGRAPCIVIGNRSAVYAPVRDLGLIAVWDDGDPLLEEPLAPYVHARDAALVRQELDGGALLFAGHTRTTDVERLVAVGWLREVATARREAPKVVLSASVQGEAQSARVPSSAFRAAREALAHGPVLVQVARPGYSPVLVCGDCRQPARCPECAGPLHAPGPRAVPVCGWCGRAARGWVCPHCESSKLRLASSGSERTADELGRAFPGVRVIVADGDHPVTHVDARPALVVATRGAEPLAAGGYRAVILLDGDRMLLAESLRIAESCLRWWSNAAALAAPGAPVHLVGVTGGVARALATWTQPAYARAELVTRAPLRMPPASRVALLEGSPAAVDRALAALREAVPDMAADAILGPLPDEDPRSDVPHARTLVRFDYASGSAVTSSLRSSVVAEALRSRRAAKGRTPRNTLRVRVDVVDPLL